MNLQKQKNVLRKNLMTLTFSPTAPQSPSFRMPARKP
jgi:hypothetical protein